MKTLLLSAAVAAAISGPAAAQMPTILRGSVVSAAPGQITVKPKAGGAPVAVTLTPDWNAQVTKPISVNEIKPGSFIGTAEMPKSEGVGRSLEVHVFPPGVKLGEGHYGWDLKKGSKMTNGTVGKVTTVGRSRELEVSYSTGQRKLVVPPGTPIVQITGGPRDLVKPGAKVFLVAAPKPGGGLVTNSVAVGMNGAAPPM